MTWSTWTSLGEQLVDVAVGEAEAELPADGHDDDIGWEAEAGERRLCDGCRAGAAGSHGSSLPAQDALPTDATVPLRLSWVAMLHLGEGRRRGVASGGLRPKKAVGTTQSYRFGMSSGVFRNPSGGRRDS